jgi:CheY-specific phosphatase CheX
LGTNAHEDKKNFNFFKDNLYIKSNKIDFFGSKSVPGSVYFNNDSNTQLNIVSPYDTDDEYCLYVTGDLPEIINSIHLNFLTNIEGIETIFTVSAPLAIKGENNIIIDFDRYRAEIDV